jgi:hypothetical protein
MLDAVPTLIGDETMLTYSQFTINGSGEVLSTDEADLVRVTTGSGDGEVTLPAAGGDVLGRRYSIRKLSGSGSIVVYPSGDELINGTESLTIGPADAPVTLQAVQTAEEVYGYETVSS